MHGARRYTWRETRDRSARLAAALRALGVGRGTTVSVMLPQHARDGRGALRGAGAERGAQHAQHPPRRRAARLAAEPLRSAVLITDREFAPMIGAGARAPARAARPRAGRDRRLRQRIRRAAASASARTSTRRCSPRTRRWRALDGPADEWDAIAVSLHLGHDRRPEGRRHPSPRRLPERGLQRGDLDDAALPALPVDAADVPLQRLVLPVDGGDARRHARLPAQGRGARRSSMRCASERVDHYCARADRPQPADRRAGRDARRASRSKVRGDGRRRGAAGGDDRGHGADRLRHHPRLRPDRGLRAGGGGGEAPGVGRRVALGADAAQRPPGRALRARGRR